MQRVTTKKEAWRPNCAAPGLDYDSALFFETFMHDYIRTTYDQIYSKNKTKPGGQVSGWTCTSKYNMCANVQGLCLTTGVDILTFARKTCVFYIVACNYLVLVYDRILAWCSTKHLTLTGQIFECLRETFYRHALEYLQSPRSEKNGGKIVFLRKRLSSFGLLMACSRWGHVFATSTNSRSRKKEGGHVSLFYCSLGRIWYQNA